MAWRVVVVDDDEYLRLLVFALLSSDPQFQLVGQALDGHQAVEAVKDHRPDLVLLDWQLPGVDGLEALPQIRQLAPGALIVMMSGSIDVRLEAWAIQAGADHFYPKHLLVGSRLTEELRDLMEGRSA